MWFTAHGLGFGHACNCSSGFEHVFIGEEKGNEISGMPNGLRFWQDEAKGRINYKRSCPLASILHFYCLGSGVWFRWLEPKMATNRVSNQ